jgi:hypothetical protein
VLFSKFKTFKTFTNNKISTQKFRKYAEESHANMIWLELQASLCSASSCLSHIDLGTENGAGHATIMTTATDDLAINNSLAAIGSTRNLYNSQKSKLYPFCLQICLFDSL